jgi:hypothetical protein
LGIGGKTEQDLIALLDDWTAHACTVGGEPSQQLFAGQAGGFSAALGRDQLFNATDQLCECSQLVDAERLFDDVTQLESISQLLREKLSRAVATRSTWFPDELDGHAVD